MIDSRQPVYTDHPAVAGRPSWPYRPCISNPPVTVSILTPFYNTDAIFLETVQTVFSQSLQEWEWVIVDDGSCDVSALAMLQAVSTQDSRIRVVSQPNRGPSAARNRAFSEAVGRYLCLLDSDDLLEPSYLEKVVWFLESQTAFAFCNSWVVYFGVDNFLSKAGFERGKDFIRANSGPPISVIRREAFAAVGGFDESIRFGHEDWDFWLKMANSGYWGHTLPEYLEWYRVRANSRYAQIVAAGDVHGKFFRYIRTKYAGLATRYPDPKLRTSQPYESLNTVLPFNNVLAKPANCKRILFLIPWMVTGGADRVNLDWIQELSVRGFQITVCATLNAQHEWWPKFSNLTPDIFILPNFLHPGDVPRFLVYLIRSRQVDTVLISHATLGYQLLPYLRGSCAGVAFIDLSHVEEPRWLNGGHPRFGIGYQDVLDLNIVTTLHLRDWMVARGADPERIAVCYSGVSQTLAEKVLTARETVRARLGVVDGLPLLVFGGRLCAQKRPEKLVAVLHDLHRKKVPFQCVVVGDGELHHLLVRRLRQFGLTDVVTMLGAIPHHQWLEVLAAGDILFLPSEYEGISVALFEAMAMGVVPVMSAVGGQGELVTPECGVLVPLSEGDVASYAAALRHLIEDPSTRIAMANASRRRIAQSFTLGSTIEKLVEIIDRSHTLARSLPRNPVPTGLALELATQAIEYARITTSYPMPTALARVLAYVRIYKVGRVILRAKVVRVSGQWLLSHFRNWRW